MKGPLRIRDYCKKLVDTLMEDIEKMSSVQVIELTILRAKLNQRAPAPPSTEAEYVRLRSWVVGLKDELIALTWRFATLDHTWDNEKVVQEVGRAEASSKANGLALQLVQAISYIHSTLSIEYR